MHVLVTGATGFIGRALIAHLLASDRRVTALVRDKRTAELPVSENLIITETGDMAAWIDCSPELIGQDVDAVVHLAGLAHVLRRNQSTDADPSLLIKSINIDATRYLCQQAISAGVKHFVYVSSVKVHGEGSAEMVITEDTPMTPSDDYALSKKQAERVVSSLSSSSSMAFTILRPALVYGPAAKGNFARLSQWIRSGYPMPLGSIKNQRSFLSRSNFISAIDSVLMRPVAYNQAFLVADPDAISTPALIRALAKAVGVSPRLVSLPVGLVQKIFWLFGRSSDWRKLSGSYVVDAGKLTRITGWMPLNNMDEELRGLSEEGA